jgi:hypothetical protein
VDVGLGERGEDNSVLALDFTEVGEGFYCDGLAVWGDVSALKWKDSTMSAVDMDTIMRTKGVLT